MDPMFLIAILLFVIPIGGLVLTGGTRRLQARTPTRLDSIFLIILGFAAALFGFLTLGMSVLGTLVFFGCGILSAIVGIMYLVKSSQG